MSDDTTRETVTIDGTTLETGDFLYTEKQFANIPGGMYMRLDLLYEDDQGDVYAVIGSYANGVGPEFDGLARVVANAVGSKLSFKKKNPQMHD